MRWLKGLGGFHCPVKSITLLVKTVQRQHKAILPSKPHRVFSRDLRVGIFGTAKHHQWSSRSQNPGQVVAVLGWVGQLVHHDKYLQRETRKHNLFISLVVDSGSCFLISLCFAEYWHFRVVPGGGLGCDITAKHREVLFFS